MDNKEALKEHINSLYEGLDIFTSFLNNDEFTAEEKDMAFRLVLVGLVLTVSSMDKMLEG